MALMHNCASMAFCGGKKEKKEARKGGFCRSRQPHMAFGTRLASSRAATTKCRRLRQARSRVYSQGITASGAPFGYNPCPVARNGTWDAAWSPTREEAGEAGIVPVATSKETSLYGSQYACTEYCSTEWRVRGLGTMWGDVV